MPVVLLLAKVPEMASEDLYTFYVPTRESQRLGLYRTLVPDPTG